MADQKNFPEGMIPLGEGPFTFRCHPEVACFTVCCRNVDLDLYPYDIIRLKNCLGIDSETFMQTYTELTEGANPYFPTVKLKLQTDGPEPACPFLTEEGCSVYLDRPTACRTYPLERAVDRSPERGKPRDYYFLTNHPYCLGHREENQFTVKQWIRNQRIDDYNLMNDLWAEVDTILAGNPFKGEGLAGPKQQMVFLACYNVDRFRTVVEERKLLEQGGIDRDRRRRIARDDAEMLKFAFDWLKSFMRP